MQTLIDVMTVLFWFCLVAGGVALVLGVACGLVRRGQLADLFLSLAMALLFTALALLIVGLTLIYVR